MSDYISKSALIELLYNTFDEYSIATDKQDALGGFGAEVFKRVKALPTVDEKEIIRKYAEQIIDKMKVLLDLVNMNQRLSVMQAMDIVKEECGISE